MFTSARLRLTAWYLLIIVLISCSFSVVIYRVLSGEVERFSRIQRVRIERHFRDDLHLDPTEPLPSPPPIDSELVAETKRRIIMMLVLVNTTIIVIAGGLGYFLAGRTLQPIEVMVDEQKRFIADASHELRTPLTALKTTLEVNVRDKKLTLAQAKVVLQTSIDEVNNLQTLTDGLLELAAFQQQKKVVTFEELSVTTLLHQAIKRVEALAKQKNITIKYSLQSEMLEGDNTLLLDLLVILLDNAIKYSSPKSMISIATTRRDGFIVLSITDQGMGIDPKDISHIFDRFYRADTARTKNAAAGYGLGLAIAQQIVQLHHGTISVTSERGKGSTFTVQLPVKQPHTK